MSQLKTTTAAEEQAWNKRQLRQRVLVPQFAIWTYQTAATVLGISQRPSELMRRAAAAAGLPLVQRQSGGGAVLVGPHLLSVSVALPPDHALVSPSITRAYQWFGELHADALRELSIKCHALNVAAARASMSAHSARSELQWACFGVLSPWEVVTTSNGKKLAGLAQRRCREGTLLVSGVLLSQFRWEPLCGVLGRPLQEAALLSELTSSCSHELKRPVPPRSLARQLERRLQAALGR